MLRRGSGGGGGGGGGCGGGGGGGSGGGGGGGEDADPHPLERSRKILSFPRGLPPAALLALAVHDAAKMTS